MYGGAGDAGAAFLSRMTQFIDFHLPPLAVAAEARVRTNKSAPEPQSRLNAIPSEQRYRRTQKLMKA